MRDLNVKAGVVLASVMFVAFVVVSFLVGCTPGQRQTAKDALQLTELACVLASQFTDAPAVMTACQIDKALSPVVEQLLVQKAQAKRAALCHADGGR
jgi:hypothetical protein